MDHSRRFSRRLGSSEFPPSNDGRSSLARFPLGLRTCLRTETKVFRSGYSRRRRRWDNVFFPIPVQPQINDGGDHSGAAAPPPPPPGAHRSIVCRRVYHHGWGAAESMTFLRFLGGGPLDRVSLEMRRLRFNPPYPTHAVLRQGRGRPPCSVLNLFAGACAVWVWVARGQNFAISTASPLRTIFPPLSAADLYILQHQCVSVFFTHCRSETLAFWHFLRLLSAFFRVMETSEQFFLITIRSRFGRQIFQFLFP